MYKCDHCPYKTSVKCNFFRHLNRKNTCHKVGTNVDAVGTNVDAAGTNVDAVGTNVDAAGTNVDALGTNVDALGTKCSKCYKYFKTKKGLLKHNDRCKGVPKLQCEICLKWFASSSSKSHHKKSVLCFYPKASFQTQLDKPSITNNTINMNAQTINNNNQCIDITNHNNHNNHNNNTYNINLNSFGSEDVWKIMQDKDISERIKWNLLNESKYAIARAVPEVFFNDKYPENKTIKKLVKNDGMVEVHTGDNQWETRLTKDTIGVIGGKINAILEYIVQNSSFNERDKRKLFKFGEYSSYFEFLDVIGDIEDKVGKEYNEPPENEKKRFQRELGKLIGDIIYKESMKII